jgi:hypothetical protein
MGEATPRRRSLPPGCAQKTDSKSDIDVLTIEDPPFDLAGTNATHDGRCICEADSGERSRRNRNAHSAMPPDYARFMPLTLTSLASATWRRISAVAIERRRYCAKAQEVPMRLKPCRPGDVFKIRELARTANTVQPAPSPRRWLTTADVGADDLLNIPGATVEAWLGGICSPGAKRRRGDLTPREEAVVPAARYRNQQLWF